MDFVLDPELARMYINNWVANQTNGQIKDLIPTSMITHTTRLVLVRRTTGVAKPEIRPLRISDRKGLPRGRFLLRSSRNGVDARFCRQSIREHSDK